MDRFRVFRQPYVETEDGVERTHRTLQALAMVRLYKKDTGGMRHERAESWARMGVAAVGTFGGALELSGTQLEKVADANLRYAKWMKFASVATRWGVRIAAIGGFAMAVMDLRRGFQEDKEGNRTMFMLYLGSGLASAFMTIAVLGKWFGVAGLLFVITLALAVAIMWLEDNSRQDWLVRTMWGNIQDLSQKYETLDVEVEQYKIAVGAL